MITKVIKVSNQVGYGYVDATSRYVYNEHDLKGNKVDQRDQDDAKYVDQIASVEIDILAEFSDVDGASSEGHGLVRFVDFNGEAVIIPYVYHGVYKDKLSAPEQVLIFDAIRDAGIKLSDELDYAADTVVKHCGLVQWDQYRQPAGKTYNGVDLAKEEEGEMITTNEIGNSLIKDMDIARELGLSIKEFRILRADIHYYKSCRRIEKIKAMVTDGYSYNKIAEVMKLPTPTIKALAESHKCTSELSDKRDVIRSEYWKMIDDICKEYVL